MPTINQFAQLRANEHDDIIMQEAGNIINSVSSPCLTSAERRFNRRLQASYGMTIEEFNRTFDL